MRIPKNHKEIIARVSKEKWSLLATRPQVPPLPVLHKFYPLGSRLGQKLYGVSVPTITVWEYDIGRFYVRSREYRRSIEAVTSLFAPHHSKAKAHVQNTLRLCRRAMAAAGFFKGRDLSRYSGAFLFQKYARAVILYAQTFTYGYFTWCVQVFQEEALRAVAQHEAVLRERGLSIHDVLGTLIISRRKSWYQKKEESLGALSKRFAELLARLPDADESLVRETSPRLHKGIVGFLKKYGWVGYDYNGPLMSFGEVVEAIRHAATAAVDTGASLKTAFRRSVFSKEEQELFTILSRAALVKDERNACDDYVHYCLNHLYAEVGRRMNRPPAEIRYLWPEEFEAALVHGRNYTSEYLSKKSCFSYFCLNGGKAAGYSGENARLALRRLLFGRNTLEDETQETAELKGMPAFSGKMVGKVARVLSYSDVGKVKDGNILVTPMTSPRFMAGIYRSGALVTDEGGIICHAAIIARELKKPCIIGTKIATKVLQDGDMVEVDADKGVVKILKRV